MDLREELTRQSLLLDFIADCVSLGTIAELSKLVFSRLHWICDFDACSLLCAGAGGNAFLWQTRQRSSLGVDDPDASIAHRSLLDRTIANRAPIVETCAEDGHCLVTLPLGTPDQALGALCLDRAAKCFSQSDVRHLQHACRALGGALTRIAAIAAEHDAEQTIKQAEAQLRSAAEDRALLSEQMIGIVSHDLRNPLSAILVGASVMALGEPLPAKKDRVLKQIDAAARRAQRLVEELLDFTRARVGAGLALRLKDVDLDALIAASMQELELSFPDARILVEADRLGRANVDADRVQQLLGNLVANAVTYGPPGQPVQISATLAGELIQLSVRNGGPVLSDELMAAMFEPMVRGTNATGENKGVGLGLFIVRAIAEGHGGHVAVDSNATDGTTFTVQLRGAVPEAAPVQA